MRGRRFHLPHVLRADNEQRGAALLGRKFRMLAEDIPSNSLSICQIKVIKPVVQNALLFACVHTPEFISTDRIVYFDPYGGNKFVCPFTGFVRRLLQHHGEYLKELLPLLPIDRCVIPVAADAWNLVEQSKEVLHKSILVVRIA
jgi:hypothetical protein